MSIQVLGAVFLLAVSATAQADLCDLSGTFRNGEAAMQISQSLDASEVKIHETSTSDFDFALDIQADGATYVREAPDDDSSYDTFSWSGCRLVGKTFAKQADGTMIATPNRSLAFELNPAGDLVASETLVWDTGKTTTLPSTWVRQYPGKLAISAGTFLTCRVAPSRTITLSGSGPVEGRVLDDNATVLDVPSVEVDRISGEGLKDETAQGLIQFLGLDPAAVALETGYTFESSSDGSAVLVTFADSASHVLGAAAIFGWTPQRCELQ